jgi:hypothetical protein
MASQQRDAPSPTASGSPPVAAAAPAGPAADETSDVIADAGGAAVIVPAPSGAFTLERGVCFGPCPVYVARVTADDRLAFDGRKFTARSGKHARDLEKGSFVRLIEAAKRHDFAALDSNWPDAKGLNCPEPPTDMPTVSVSIETPELNHAVKFYEGCAGYPAAERMIAMVKDADAILALDEWIGPREAFYGKRQPK